MKNEVQVVKPKVHRLLEIEVPDIVERAWNFQRFRVSKMLSSGYFLTLRLPYLYRSLDGAVRVFHDRIQYPVGHGGFHVGRVWLHGRAGRSGRPFVYIYDCGAKGDLAIDTEEVTSRALNAALDSLFFSIGEQKIDAFFLSHLHEDHFLGLAKVVKRHGVRRVFIPLVTPLERLILKTQAGSGADPVWLSFLDDPKGALGDGVDEIIYVTKGGGARVPSDRPDGEPWGGDIPPEAEFVLEVEPLKGAEPAPSPGSGAASGGALERVIGDAAPIKIRLGGTILWEFRLYVGRPKAEREKKLLAVIRRKFPDLKPYDRVLSAEEAVHLVSAVESKKALKRCYEEVFSELNRRSLCLLSRPAFRSLAWHGGRFCGDRLCTSVGAPGRRSDSCSMEPPRDFVLPAGGRVGWLGLGDAILKGTRAVKKLDGHMFDNAGDRDCGTVLVPHHGSKGNSCACLYETLICRSAVVTVPASWRRSEPAKRHHPAEEVLSAITETGTCAVAVDEREAFAEIYWHELPSGR